jgi:flavin reductase (DIM6/NTAB) family NADH-FMN oxidoreductase RutF
MLFDLTQTSPRETYNLLIGLVAPRPVALITSMDLEGRLNAAPFSAFNYLGTDPPILAVGVGNRPGPSVVGKDTAQNIRNRREFVVNVVNEDIAEAMNICAIDFPPGTNELDAAKLTTAKSTAVLVPRIAEAPAALECVEHATLEIGRSRVILGRVLHIYVRDEFVDRSGPYIRADALHAIGRMNGLGNCVRTRDFLQIPRLSYEEWRHRSGDPVRGLRADQR